MDEGCGSEFLQDDDGKLHSTRELTMGLGIE